MQTFRYSQSWHSSSILSCFFLSLPSVLGSIRATIDQARRHCSNKRICPHPHSFPELVSPPLSPLVEFRSHLIIYSQKVEATLRCVIVTAVKGTLPPLTVSRGKLKLM